MTIGKIAKKVGVGVETIRFYEREGLIEQPKKYKSGFRQYSKFTADRILFIKASKELGFSLKEIKEILTLRISADTKCEDIEAMAAIKIKDVNEKIRQLTEIKETLEQLTNDCKSKGITADYCPGCMLACICQIT